MGFDTALKRYFAGVILALIAMAAYFQASGITQLVGSALAPDARRSPRRRAGARARPPPVSARPDDHATSARCDPRSQPVRLGDAGPLDAPAVDADAAARRPSSISSTTRTRRRATGSRCSSSSASSDPAWSFAALSARARRRPSCVRVGDEIGGKTVHIVEWDRVVLSTGVVALPGADVPAGQGRGRGCRRRARRRRRRRPPRPWAAARRTVPPEIASKIQKVSATEFNIDRQVVDKILENQAELMRSARIVPEQENGKVVGIRLFGIRPDTLLGTLGHGERRSPADDQRLRHGEPREGARGVRAPAHRRPPDGQVNRRGQNMNIDFNIK